ncbi:TPA: hypothetical protein KKX11_002952 [Legionella pneumophila]|nr:hypothetical protein [Legionella pneumophila]HCD9576076.1 hypothetical protein [Legionella pneumophila]HEL8421103.1 hypothetical protein [Legionella pneumophila]
MLTLMLCIALLFEGIQVICGCIDMVSSMYITIMVERQYQGQWSFKNQVVTAEI